MQIVLWECLVGVVPLTVLTIVTLGAILAGLTTPPRPRRSARSARSCWSSPTAGSRGGLAADACYSTMATTSMVLLLAVTSNIFGAVFARLGTANWITDALLASPLPPGS